MKTNRKTLIYLIVALGLLVSTAACGSTPQDTNGKPSAPAAEEPAKPLEAGPGASAVPTEPEPAGEPEVQPPEDPSGEIHLPGGLTARRGYDRLELVLGREANPSFSPVSLPLPGSVEAAGWRFRCRMTGSTRNLPSSGTRLSCT